MMLREVRDTGQDDGGGQWLHDNDGNDDVAGATDDDGQDPIRSLHDTEEEAGDEAGITDTYRMDTLGAEQLHVALDPAADQEATLD